VKNAVKVVTVRAVVSQRCVSMKEEMDPKRLKKLCNNNADETADIAVFEGMGQKGKGQGNREDS